MHFCGKRNITLKNFNYKLAFFCLFSLSSNAACSSVPCTMSVKVVVLFTDGFKMLLFNSLG